MHKKSIEAAEKMKDDEDICDVISPASHEESPSRDREEIRSESIATLRAKAQQHSEKIRKAIHLSDSDSSNSESTAKEILQKYASRFEHPSQKQLANTDKDSEITKDQ